MNVRRLFFNQCSTYQQDISLMASGCLSGPQQSALQKHLAECAGCRQRLADLQQVTAGLKSWAANQPEFEPSREFQFKLQQAIRTADRKQSETESDPVGFLGVLIGAARARWGALATAWIIIVLLNLHTPQSLTQTQQVARPVSAQKMLMTLKSLRSELPRLNEKEDVNEIHNNLPAPQSRKHGLPENLKASWMIES